MESDNKIKFNLEEELAKVIVANCVTGFFIRSGIRKKDNHLVLISSVRKNGENFYIPVLTIAEFLKKKFNKDNEFKNLEDLKQSFEKLLFDIDENERELIKGKNVICRINGKLTQGEDDVIYSVNGRRFLGIDGLCYYLGKRIGNLPTFTLGKNTPEDNAFRAKGLISDKEAVKWIDRSLNRQFETVKLCFDPEYEVEKYPISLDEQENAARQCKDKEIKITKYGKSFFNVLEKNGEQYNTVSTIINDASSWKKNNLMLYQEGVAKYCNRCNYVPDRCDNKNSKLGIINSSFEINDNLKTLDSNSEIEK